MIQIPENLDGLLVAAERILDGSPTAGPIIEGLKTRKKWEAVKRRYQVLREDMTGHEAIRHLAKEFHYSEKSIEAILYTR